MEHLSDEPEQVAEAAAHLKLRYVVITSVNRRAARRRRQSFCEDDSRGQTPFARFKD
jgi:lipoate synthase